MGCKNDAPSALRTAVSALRAFLIARHDPSSSSLVRCASQPEMRGHFDCRTRRKGQFLGVVLCFSFLISLPVFSITGTFQGRVVEGTKREAGKYIYVAGRGGLMRRVNIQKCRVRFGADVPPSQRVASASESLKDSAEVRVTAEQDNEGEWMASEIVILKLPEIDRARLRI